MPRASDPNHASAEEIEPFEPLSRTKPIRRCTAPSSPPKEAVRPARPPQTSANKAAAPGSQDTQASRLHEEDEKLDIFRQYHAWVLGGKLTSQSPIKGLVNKYSCNKSIRSAFTTRSSRVARRRTSGLAAGLASSPQAAGTR